MKKKFLKTIKDHKLIERGDHIVLGLSGGPDSVCLLYLLLGIMEEYDLTIHPIHVNHCFRNEEADRDQEFVKELCLNLDLDFKCLKIDCAKIATDDGITSEEAGRKVRYREFNNKANELLSSGISKKSIKIATAQNANDQAETILFRIMRGTGMEGLKGIPYIRNNEDGFEIIRPILDIKREEIEGYLQKNEINYVTDSTNLEPLYSRNKIRLNLLPLMETQFNPNIIETLKRLSESASSDQEFINTFRDEVYDKILVRRDEKKVEINISPLENIHKAIIFRLYNKALNQVGLNSNITLAQLKEIEKIRKSKSPSASLDLTEGYRVFRKYENMIFIKGENLEEKVSANDVWIMNNYSLGEFKKLKFLEVNKLRGIFFLNNANDVEHIKIRHRSSGDYIRLESGRKKIKDLFQDMKIPKIYRDNIDLLTIGHEVLWVMPSPFFPLDIHKEKGRFSSEFKFKDGEDSVIIVLERK